jgi:hypothetical protein
MPEEDGKQGLPNMASFYIGVVDLFAVFLPGGILAFLLIPCVPLADFPQSKLASSPAVQWVAFSVAAYALGHLLFGLGGMVMDGLYSVFFKNGSRRLRMRRERAYSELSRLVGFKANTGDNALDWTLAILRLKEPGGLADLDRMEADSKFMRSLTLTLVLSLPLIQYARKGYAGTFGTVWLVLGALLAGVLGERVFTRLNKWGSRVRWINLLPAAAWFVGVALILARHPEDPFFVRLGMGSIVLSIITASRFMDLRQKRTRIAYELLLVSFSPNCHIPATTATAANNP